MLSTLRTAWLLAGLIVLLIMAPKASFAQQLQDWEAEMPLNHLTAGRSMADKGRYQEAIKRYSRAIDSGKLNKLNLSIAYNNRGNAYAELGEHERALEDFNSSLKARPGFVEAIYNRGITHFQLGNYEKSVEDFGLVILVNAGFASAYFNRSFPLAELGRYKEAIADVRQAINLSPGSLYYQQRLANLQGAARSITPMEPGPLESKPAGAAGQTPDAAPPKPPQAAAGSMATEPSPPAGPKHLKTAPAGKANPPLIYNEDEADLEARE